MCGIWTYIGSYLSSEEASALLGNLSARGPEGSRLDAIEGKGYMGFSRLAINGLNEGGMQPFIHEGVRCICNGEIYNAAALSAEYGIPMPSGSDCEILAPLYSHFCRQGDEERRTLSDSVARFFRALDGVFAIVIYDEARGKLVWGRDPYGVRPLFAGWTIGMSEGLATGVKVPLDFSELTFALLASGATLKAICLTSEMKAMPSRVHNAVQFSPGYYGFVNTASGNGNDTFDGLCMMPYHVNPWLKNPSFSPAHPEGFSLAKWNVRFALEEAVRKRMLTERPVAALLSGGVDSSLIASLVQRRLRALGRPSLRTFSIGMPGSTDIAFARKVAAWIGSNHTEVILTADDFFAAIPAVIHDIESYDITTVRASVGNWLVSKAIREQTECKVVFNGDGSDEVFGSYLYFYNAPDDSSFEKEVDRRLRDICYFDVLRSDRTISSHGLEPRTPFLDKQFVNVCLSVASCWRRPLGVGAKKQVEKFLLRSAFDDDITLPKDVLWRQKEAFSDGVSSKEKSWFEEIQERVAPLVPADWQEMARERFPYLTPKTAEAYYYRMVYESQDYSRPEVVIPYMWMPRWSPGVTDPSARALAVYTAGT